MQKTLLYTEGLGREFNPELDLWKTSKPILEKWMKDQKGPRGIAKKLFTNFDDYLRYCQRSHLFLEEYQTTIVETHLS